MEPVSFAVGIVGLAGLFNTCLDILDKFDSWKDFGSDSQNLSAQFKAHKLRLERWGEAVGFKDEGISDAHDKALDDPRVLSTVNELLTAVKDVCCLGDEVFAPSDFTSDRMARKHMPSRIHTRPNITKESKMQKLHWALRNRAKKITQVGQFASLVDILYSLIPIGKGEKTPFQIDECKCDGDSSMHSDENLFDRKGLDAQFGDLLSRLQNEMEVDAKREIHTWLLGGHLPNETYGRSTESRIEGTCEWILSTPWFLQWYSSEFQAGHPKILWVNAPAGFGKSILCARVVDHLLSTLKEPVSHFFFSTDLEREDHFVAIRTWLSQMMSYPAVYAIIRDIWALQQGVKATRHEITGLLRHVVEAVPGCTFILDGLDECSRMADRRDGSTAGFLDTIAQATAGTKTRLLVVSRDEPEIRNSLSTIREVLLIQHKITPDLVRSDIDIYSRSVVEKKLAKKTEAIKEDISQKLADRCNGQFLWIKLQQDDLRSTANQKALQRIINSTPVGLEDAYERNWMRICRLSDEYRSRAFNILRWAAFSLRPLAVNEIAGALLVTEEDNEVLVDEIPDEIDEDYIDIEILKDCNSLLEIRSSHQECPAGMKTVHLAHFSVKEYLLLNIPTQSRLLQINSTLGSSSELIENTLLAKMCLRYLNCGTIWDSSIEQYELFSCFRNYAAESWQQHSSLDKKTDHQITKLISDLFDTRNESWTHWKEWFDSTDKTAKDSSEMTSSSPMWYAASLGLIDVVQSFINAGKDAVDERGNGGFTALGVACYGGHLEIARLLLGAGADMTITTVERSTPIYCAAGEGHMEVVELLINEGADFRGSHHKSGSSPLHAATNSGNINVVQLLLDHGADVSAGGTSGETPILIASWNGYLDIVSLLVNEEAQLDATNNDGLSPLNAALSQGHLDIAEILLSKNADIQILTQRGWNSLHFASRYGFLNIVKILIEKGAKIDSSDRDGWTALFLACCFGHVEVASLLISHGASVNIIDVLNRIPLDTTSTRGHVDVVKLLLGKGIDIEATDDDGWTAIIVASYEGHLEVVQLLLENGADVKATTNSGWTALVHASDKGHLKVAQLLLDNGADVKAMTNSGWTALAHASDKGHPEIAQLLLDNGADIKAAIKNGWTALINASDKGYFEIVQLLLDHGVDIEATEDGGWTALITASNEGHLEVVRLLLDSGAEISAATNNGWTALMYASCKGHLEVVQLLLNNGASIKAKTNHGWTALMHASYKSHFEVVQLLLDNGADIETASDSGWNSLLQASDKNHFEVVQLLLDNGADIEATSNSGWTPLMHASDKDHLKVIQLLLDNGADIEATSNSGWTPLMHASDKGHLEVVQLLLENNADTEAASNIGWTSLMHASDKGHLEVVQLLLDNFADIEATSNSGWTPLMHASNEGHLEVVQLLLENNADIEATFNSGWTPLMHALDKNHLEVVQLLLDNGADFEVTSDGGWTPLMHASVEGHLEVVQSLLDNNAKIEATRYGWTALIYASYKGHTSIVKLLLDNGADIEAVNRDGYTALNSASYRGHSDVVKLLLESGADLKATSKTGHSALTNASEEGHLAVIKLLLDTSATTIQAVDKWGRTALYHAASAGQKDVVSLYLANNVPVDLVDHWGATCLFTAVRNGHSEVVNQLISLTALSVQSRDFLDRSLFWWAKKSGSIEVVEILLRHAENTDVRIPEEELQMEISCLDSEKTTRCCDVCLRYIFRGHSYRKCQVCFDFDVCLNCFGLGARCLEPSHEIFLHEPDVFPERIRSLSDRATRASTPEEEVGYWGKVIMFED